LAQLGEDQREPLGQRLAPALYDAGCHANHLVPTLSNESVAKIHASRIDTNDKSVGHSSHN
jgi:hypothetical protein